MSDPVDLETLVERIHAAPVQLVLAITGGGSRAISELLERPGGSRVLLEAIVPYASQALVDFLDATPDQFCSARTSRLMAMAAYLRAQALSGEPQRSIGVGCTASLASNRPKRGDHRVYVAYQSFDSTVEFSMVLTKGRRTRLEEEHVAANLVLGAIGDACGGLGQLDHGGNTDEPLEERRAVAEIERRELLHGLRRQVLVGRAPIVAGGQRRAIFPGAFNPLHEGHRQMARLARERLGLPIEFEISIHNVDKAPLDFLEMRDRGEQFDDEQTVWLTRAPTFEEKSRLFADATFVVGADTIARIGDPSYYGGSEKAMLAAIDRIGSRGGRFLVFGRAEDRRGTVANGDSTPGRFQTLASLELPQPLSALCTEVPEYEFHADVSSTQLRRAAENQAE